MTNFPRAGVVWVSISEAPIILTPLPDPQQAHTPGKGPASPQEYQPWDIVDKFKGLGSWRALLTQQSQEPEASVKATARLKVSINKARGGALRTAMTFQKDLF